MKTRFSEFGFNYTGFMFIPNEWFPINNGKTEPQNVPPDALGIDLGEEIPNAGHISFLPCVDPSLNTVLGLTPDLNTALKRC